MIATTTNGPLDIRGRLVDVGTGKAQGAAVAPYPPPRGEAQPLLQNIFSEFGTNCPLDAGSPVDPICPRATNRYLNNDTTTTNGDNDNNNNNNICIHIYIMLYTYNLMLIMNTLPSRRLFQVTAPKTTHAIVSKRQSQRSNR